MTTAKYKQTEIGIIPEDWEVKRLEQIATLINGRAYKQHELLPVGKYKVLRVGNFFTNDSWYFSNLELDEKLYCNKEDLLYAWSCTYGAYIWSDGKTIFHYHIWKVLCSNVDKKLLFYLLNNDIENQKQSSQGGTMSHITKGYMENRLFALPPSLDEQIAIATALSDMDEYILSLERLITKKKAIKQGAMQQLLTGKIRLNGFKGEWVEKRLGEIGIITSSGVDKKIVQGEKPITLLNYLDVYRNTYIKRSLLSHVVTATNDKIKNCSIQKGDVFFTPTSETPDDIAKTAVSLETMNDVVYSYHLIRLRPYADYNGEFIKFACDTNNFMQQAERFADGSGTRYVISIKKFNKMTVFIPPTLAEQSAIATILSDMDTEIEVLHTKLQKVKLIKQGAMQQLLTGKIRICKDVSRYVSTEQITKLKPKQIVHNDQINEAVVISFLVHKFGTEQYPLSRFRYTKYAYLLHRQAEHEAKGFLKHAAGPYKPENRYKGGEGIALKNNYITKVKNPLSGADAFIVNEQIEKALSYFCEWYGTNIQEWIEQFRYYKNEYLEVLATVDESVCDLQVENRTITVSSIKEYIGSIPQWKEKLNKPYFNDLNIQKAINESYNLFGG